MRGFWQPQLDLGRVRRPLGRAARGRWAPSRGARRARGRGGWRPAPRAPACGRRPGSRRPRARRPRAPARSPSGRGARPGAGAGRPSSQAVKAALGRVSTRHRRVGQDRRASAPAPRRRGTAARGNTCASPTRLASRSRSRSATASAGSAGRQVTAGRPRSTPRAWPTGRRTARAARRRRGRPARAGCRRPAPPRHCVVRRQLGLGAAVGLDAVPEAAADGVDAGGVAALDHQELGEPPVRRCRERRRAPPRPRAASVEQGGDLDAGERAGPVVPERPAVVAHLGDLVVEPGLVVVADQHGQRVAERVAEPDVGPPAAAGVGRRSAARRRRAPGG